MNEPRRYLTDDCDQGRVELLVHHASDGNGDWYVSIVREGQQFNQLRSGEDEPRAYATIRFATSGARSSQRGCAAALSDLYRAMGGEEPLDTRNPFADILGEEDPRIPELEAEVTRLRAAEAAALVAIKSIISSNPRAHGEALLTLARAMFPGEKNLETFVLDLVAKKGGAMHKYRIHVVGTDGFVTSIDEVFGGEALARLQARRRPSRVTLADLEAETPCSEAPPVVWIYGDKIGQIAEWGEGPPPATRWLK